MCWRLQRGRIFVPFREFVELPPVINRRPSLNHLGRDLNSRHRRSRLNGVSAAGLSGPIYILGLFCQVNTPLIRGVRRIKSRDKVILRQ